MISYTRIVPHYPRIRRSSRSVRTQVAFILIFTWLSFPCVATAGTLTVVGDMDVTWNGGPSPTVTLGLKNDTALDDWVMTFQLELQIVAGPSATGQLLFDSAWTPSTGYLFGGGGLQPNPAYNGPPTSIIENFFDIDFNFGTLLAAGDSANLIQFDFDDSLSPQGEFFITLGPFNGDFASYYSSVTSGGDATSFANVGTSNGHIIVANVILGAQQAQPVPEPHAALAAIIGAALYWIRRRGAGFSQSFS